MKNTHKVNPIIPWGKKVMKTGVGFFLLLQFISLSVFSQSILQSSKVTLNMKDASLKSVLTAIERQSKLNFVYNHEEIAKINKITISEKDAELDKVMKRLLSGTGLIYTLEGGNAIIIGPAPKSSKNADQAVVPTQLEGKVVDNNGKPIENATIRIKGVNNVVVVTSSSGRFSIRMAADNQVLAVSHMGYNPKEITLKKGQQSIEISLDDLSHRMDDIVITGISEVKKEIFSGSSTSFSGEQLRKMSSANILQGLGLLDPSFRIVENNQFGSDPNALPEIEMRGGSDLGGTYPSGDLRGAFYGNPNLPLFILDGFETTLERIIDLDMNRIESLTLLKDGSAAALYGTRSSNGVVVIVTKAPVEGKLRTTYNINSTVVTPDLTGYNMLNAADLLDFELRAGVYNGATIGEHITKRDQYNDRLGMVKSGVDTYWLSQPLRTAVEQRHSLGIEGGDRTFKYNVGVGYASNPGVMKGSSRNTYQGNVGIYYTKGNLLFRNDLQLANTNSKASPYGSFQPFVYAKPYFAIPEDNSMFLWEQFTGGQRTAYMLNPLYNGTINTQSLSGYTEVLNNFSAEWRLNSDFKITSSFGFSKRFADSKNFRPANHTDYLNITPEMESYSLRGDMNVTNTKSSNYEVSAYAIYNKTFGKGHQIYSQLGANIKESVSSVDQVMAQGFPNPNLDDLAFAKGYTLNTRPGGLDNTNRLAGLLAMINYSYDSKYFGDFSFKYDGSSQFGMKTKYAPVWSAGLGWNMHKEKFIQNLRFFNSLRLTGSISETASQNFAPYQAMTKYQYQTDNIYGEGFGAIIQGMANEDIKWQTTKQNKVALDMIFLNSRVNLSAEYYWKKTMNLIQSVTIAPSTGFNSFMDNVGELSNNGFDIRLSVTALKGFENRPRLTFWGNIGANKNIISKVSNAMKQRNQVILEAMQWQYSGEDPSSTYPPNLFIEGSSRSTIYAVPSLGIDPMTGRELYLYRDGSVGRDWLAVEQIGIADSRPKVSGGFGTTLTYKGWDLVVAGSYSVGGYMYNSTLVSKVEDIDIRNQNVDARTLNDKWIKPGDHALYRAFSFVNGETRVGSTSRFVQKNDYLTLSTITLGYTLLNKEKLRNWKIERFRVNMTLNDIARISTIQVERGTDYPFARRISLGASISF
ncbi:MAG: SusC/RagA family TonB-linked outer membrane protein [Sphingobacterium sp.]|nr:SusC/RagA family TonB-linked outer membrane protein [Sphingobacterium sp.]